MFREKTIRFLRILPLLGLVALLSGCNGDLIVDIVVRLAEVCGAPAFVVTTFENTVDNACTADDCSLRDALFLANFCGGSSTIQLSEGTYKLDEIDNESSGGVNGLPIIRAAITIEGNSAIIQRSDDAPDFRIFRVLPTGSLTLVNLSIINGVADSESRFGNQPGDFGGAIYNSGDVTIRNSAISGNVANGQGGAIYNEGILAVVDGSVVTENQVLGIVAAGMGGGIFNEGDGHVQITNATLSNNTVGRIGGAIYNRGQITIIDSTISGNSSFNAGGINNLGDLAISGSAVISNLAESDAGGLRIELGNVMITSSTFHMNTAGSLGGAIMCAGGRSLTLRDNTIYANITKIDAGINSSCQTSVENTIIAGNMPSDCAVDRSFVPMGANISGDSSCPGFTFTDTDPHLLPLTDNGGPTQTLALAQDSPAVDTGANCLATDQRGFPRPVDGGSGRDVCDVGAFELQ